MSQILKYHASNPMNDFALLLLFTIASLFSVAFIVRRYRTATVLQRRQILMSAGGAFVLAGGLLCYVAFR